MTEIIFGSRLGGGAYVAAIFFGLAIGAAVILVSIQAFS